MVGLRGIKWWVRIPEECRNVKGLAGFG